jgi:hypothetical protein
MIIQKLPFLRNEPNNMRLAAIVLSIIFILHSISAVGLYNSNDAPQYFTGEAIVKHHSIDIGSFSADKHYFVHPDVTVVNGRSVGIRGYMVSLLTTPLHVAAEFIGPLLTTKNMPPEILSAGFKKELALTQLFPIFTIIGLGFLYVTVQEVVGVSWIAALSILLMGLGTYAWKFGTMYARQPIMLALLGAAIFLVWRIHNNKSHKNVRGYLYIYALLAALSFGIDSILFLALSLYFGLYLFMNVRRDRGVLLALIPYAALVATLAFSHYYFYNNLNFALYNAYPVLLTIPEAERSAFLLSTPLFPTVFYILFGFGQLPAASFTHFLPYPEVATAFSASFAQRYMFYGLFSVSPFLLLSIFGFKSTSKKHTQPYTQLMIFSGLLFIIGILANTKNFGFYAANSYDIRYFYPYAMLLVVPSAMGMKRLIQGARQAYKAIVVATTILFLALFSIFMSWIGLLNMYKSSLTGERRIWIDHTGFNTLSSHTYLEYLNATFLNRENIGVAVLLCVVAILISLGIRQIFFPQTHLSRK